MQSRDFSALIASNNCCFLPIHYFEKQVFEETVSILLVIFFILSVLCLVLMSNIWLLIFIYNEVSY